MVFVGVARLLMIMNSCINPFIYAWTIPAFRNNIQKLAFKGMKREVNQPNTTVDQQQNRFYKKSDLNVMRIHRPSYSVTYVH